MKKLQEFTIEIGSCEDQRPEDLRVWLRMKTHYSDRDYSDRPKGIHHISFLLIGDEWRRLFSDTYCDRADIAHRVSTFGESWTFYDLAVPGPDIGEMMIPYLRIKMPCLVRDLISLRIDGAIGEFRAQQNTAPIVLDFSGELNDWAENYGQGTGTVEIDATAETRDALGALRGEKTFDQSWSAIDALARNTTHAKVDTSTVKIWLEGGCKSFGWIAGPMSGGLINHGSDDAPRWSVHT